VYQTVNGHCPEEKARNADEHVHVHKHGTDRKKIAVIFTDGVTR
jgi:GrpB-like predicted nucleotidyltransferase (UPF0157 family)